MKSLHSFNSILPRVKVFTLTTLNIMDYDMMWLYINVDPDMGIDIDIDITYLCLTQC